MIGAGLVAARKAQSLLATGARLVVVGKNVDDLPPFPTGTNVELVKSRYSRDYLMGASIVIAATNNDRINRQIYRDCQELEILCNVVDEPELCDFFIPAVVKRGDLQIAIGTDGKSPAYAGHLRKKLEEQFTELHGDFLAELEVIRKTILETIADSGDRKSLLGSLVKDESFEHFVKNGAEAWRKRTQKIIEDFCLPA